MSVAPCPVNLDPALLDALLFSVRHRPELLPDPQALVEHDRALDRIYRATAGAARRAALDRENGRLAAHLGLVEQLAAALSDHPTITSRLSRAILSLAREGDQRADLCGPDPAGRFCLVVRLEPAVWTDPARLKRHLDHELAHASDMLDPAFAYDPRAAWPGSTRGERERAREHFTALWCAAVDARLAGLEAERPFTHAALLARASELAAAAARGHACPLCGFPSSEWADPTALAGFVDEIRCDFPAWQAGDGSCRRCLESYEARPRAKVQGRV